LQIRAAPTTTTITHNFNIATNNTTLNTTPSNNFSSSDVSNSISNLSNYPLLSPLQQQQPENITPNANSTLRENTSSSLSDPFAEAVPIDSIHVMSSEESDTTNDPTISYTSSSYYNALFKSLV